jgi:dTDP-4-amino-4,6-dideoxygalactose transaminase
MAGTFGAASAISFFPAKTLGSLGDGGAVLTSDDAIAQRVRRLGDHGRSGSGEIEDWGLNSRLDNLQAAILDWRLARLDSAIERRRSIARRYHARLSSLGPLVLPPAPDDAGPHFDTYQNYEIEAEQRDKLRAFLESRGIGTIVQWGGKAVHQWPALGFKVRLPFTERLFERLLLVPMNTSLSDDEADYVCDQISAFYG